MCWLIGERSWGMYHESAPHGTLGICSVLLFTTCSSHIQINSTTYELQLPPHAQYGLQLKHIRWWWETMYKDCLYIVYHAVITVIPPVKMIHKIQIQAVVNGNTNGELYFAFYWTDCVLLELVFLQWKYMIYPDTWNSITSGHSSCIQNVRCYAFQLSTCDQVTEDGWREQIWTRPSYFYYSELPDAWLWLLWDQSMWW